MGVWPLSRPWRLLISEAGSGAWNMALDQALWESVRRGGRPFLRFYRWDPATLSLGRFQNTEDGLASGASLVPRVRRPTGGGGIWHDDELTYSLGCAQSDVGELGVKASFEILCGFLLDTYRDLGWKASYAKDAPDDTARGEFTPACFAGREDYDLLVDGKKLGGNAQKRDRLTIFQHGSLPRRLNHEVLARLFLPGFRPDPNAVTDLLTCGWDRPAEQLIPPLVEHFRQRLGVEWEEALPTPEESAEAERLVDQQYGSGAWTDGGGGSLRPRQR